MSLGIAVSLVVVTAVVIGAFVAYRRTMRSFRPDGETRPVNGSRLTSERLRQLPSPPWRVVYEIAADRLAGVDHVVIGPSGVFAVATSVTDRPADEPVGDALRVAAAASQRAAVDELAVRAGVRCEQLVQLHWGAPRPGSPLTHHPMHAVVAVEGQRLGDWLTTLPPGPLTTMQVDLAWQAITTGVGRPDPLA